jgi:hypothetical protein
VVSVTAGAADAEHEDADLFRCGARVVGAGAHDRVGEVVAHHDVGGFGRERLAFLDHGVGMFGLGEELAGTRDGPC